MLDLADTTSLALLYHLNSEPWTGTGSYEEHGFEVHAVDRGDRRARIALPPADEDRPLLELMRRRASCRRYAPSALAAQDVSTLLAGAYGLGRVVSIHGGLEARARPAPSAGALYPLELHVLTQRVVALPDGLYRYEAVDHALESTGRPLDRGALAEVLLAAPLVENANLLVFLTAAFERSTQKYGARGYRYILLEAGHVAQNICLLAAEAGLASLCVGGFMDAATNRLLGFAARGEAALYCVAVGHPADAES